MDFHSSAAECKVQPSPCLVCGKPSWRNGDRVVAQVWLNADGGVSRKEVVRRRVRCSDRTCTGGSWTIYEPQGYPHRSFTPAVTASAVAELAASPGATLTSVARRCGCDRRTVGRWVRWIRGLGEPQALSGICARIDPSGLPPPASAGLERFAQPGLLVLLLEHLARLLRNHGVPLEHGPGLAAILRHQFDRFRTVFWLTRASPPLHVEGAWAGS